MRQISYIGLVTLILSCVHVLAQAPQGINYQGVARGLDGQPLSQKEITIRISILNGSADGELEYDEIHEVKTNSFGLFTLVIGEGEPGTSDFSFIGWTSGKKFLQIEMDENGGLNFKLMGSQQLMSVPYALYAERSGNGYQAGQGIYISNNMISNAGDGDNDATNELISSVALGVDNKLRITDAGGTKETDLSSLLGASQNLSNVLTEGNSAGSSTITDLAAPVNASDAATKAYVDAYTDGDADAINEIQNLTQVLAEGNDAGGSKITNLGAPITNSDAATKAYVDSHVDGDASSTNEIQDLSQVLLVGGNAGGSKISNLGNPIADDDAATKLYVDNLDLADGDKIATNEIQDLNLAGNTLRITNNASATNINLGPYLDNTDNQDLSLNTSTNVLNLSGDGTPVDLSPYKQDLGLSANILSLSGDATTVDLSGYVNTDNQNLSLNSSTNALGISGGTGVDLSSYKQDLSISGSNLSLTGDVTTVSLAPFLDDTDEQTLSYDSPTKTITISGGNNITIPETQNLDQVLTINNSAGAKSITNLADPSNAQDAATRKYVDDADAILSSKISTTYAFKTSFTFTNSSGGVLNNQQMNFTIEEFDSFNVLSTNSFTAAENGIYFFTVEGSLNPATTAGSQLFLLFNSIKYPINIVVPFGGILPRFTASMMFSLSVGQTVTLIGDNVLNGDIFNGKFYGFKL